MRIDIEEAQKNFSELIGKIVFGNDKQVIITKRGLPVAIITDYYEQPRKRRAGVADGKFTIPDNWDELEYL